MVLGTEPVAEKKVFQQHSEYHKTEALSFKVAQIVGLTGRSNDFVTSNSRPSIMDQYAGNLPTSSSYSPLPSIAPQQLQQNAPLPPDTLPPLQAQHNALSMHSMYGQSMSAPHTPISSVPNTAGNIGNGGFQHMTRGYRIQGAPYQPSPQNYSTSSSMIPQNSVALSHPQPIAPAPSQTSSHNRLVPLRPMTSAPLLTHNSMHSQLQSGMTSPYSQQSPGQDQDTPTHVVGSQGRRGILPSAPGRPAVTATGPGSTKNASIPAKDADGKFPCPHCTKTYLHAKHLKRHLLRREHFLFPKILLNAFNHT
jgi:hypothetical protein